MSIRNFFDEAEAVPVSWFKASDSYGLLSGRGSCLSATGQPCSSVASAVACEDVLWSHLSAGAYLALSSGSDKEGSHLIASASSAKSKPNFMIRPAPMRLSDKLLRLRYCQAFFPFCPLHFGRYLLSLIFAQR